MTSWTPLVIFAAVIFFSGVCIGYWLGTTYNSIPATFIMGLKGEK